MIITEDIIRRIARQVFNVMFPSALRQSNVGGTVNDVQHAVEADHAIAADAVPWTGVTDKPATATRWPAFSEVTGSASANQLPNIENLTNFSNRVYDATVNRTANTVLAGPTNGNATPATFRSLVAADIPILAISKISGLQTALDSKLDIAFFGRLFQAYNGTTAVNPNDTATTIDNIKAMFGFWTEQYISALGQGSGGGGGGQGDVTWALLADNSDTRQIAASHITGLLGGTFTGKNYAVQKDANGKLYVNVPWVDNDHYDWADITNKPATATRWPAWSEVTNKPTAVGGATQPVYWNGTGFAACTSYANASVNHASTADSATNATTAANGNQMNVMATIGGQNTTNYPWRLLAKSVEVTTNYVDTDALIVLRQFSNGGRTGILKIAFRTNEISTTASSASAVWMVRYGFAVDDVKVALYWEAGKSYADIYLKATAWNRMEMHVIRNRSWTFVSSNEGTDGANPVNAYASIEAAATAIHGRAYSSISNSSDGGIVSHANTANSATTAASADSVTWTNVSGKPSTFTPSAHEHAWTDITSGVPATATRWPSWSEVTNKPSSKTAWGQTYLDSNSSFQNVSGNMTSVGDISFSASGKKIGGFLWFDTTNQRLGVGTSSPSYPLHVVGDGYFSGNMLCHHVLQGISSIEFRAFENTSGIGGWLDFHFDGSATADYSSRIAEYASGVITLEGSFVATGAVSALSDARDKRVIGEVPLTVEQIAQMPAVVFEWKNTKHHDDRQHIGTLAQPWQKVLPQAIMPTHDDRLSFDYASAAMVSVIKLAQRLVKLEGIMKSYGFKF